MGIKTAVTNLLRGKGRTALTVISIAVGIFAITIISAVGKIGTDKINKTLDDMGINSVLVEPDSFTLDEKDVTALAELKGVNKTMPLMMNVTECRLINEESPCIAWGVNEDADEIISLNAIHGRLINKSDIENNSMVCVIDKDIAENAYKRSNIVGKKIEISLGGKEYEFEIVGVATSGLNSIQSMMSKVMPYFAYIPYTTVQNLCNSESYDKIAVSLSDNQNGDILKDIANVIGKSKGASTVTVNNLLGQKKQLDGILSVAASSLSLVAGISLIVSALSVMTSMLVTVNERKREIGIKKALGAKNSRIVAEFISESVLVCIFGCIIGFVSGAIVNILLCIILSEPLFIQTDILLSVMIICIIMGVVSAGYPSLKAAKTKPVDVLKSDL